jgi:nitrogen fixation NifU-like protein
MDDLQTLYQSIIRQHQKEPRWRGLLATANASADGENPKCGDQIEVHAQIADGTFVALRFEAAGCALLNASASIMCASMEGQTTASLAQKIALIQNLLNRTIAPDLSELGELSALAGAAPYPSRHRCVLLPWDTLAKLADNPARRN